MGGRDEDRLLKDYDISFWSDKNVLEPDGGGGWQLNECTKYYWIRNFKMLKTYKLDRL